MTRNFSNQFFLCHVGAQVFENYVLNKKKKTKKQKEQKVSL